MVPLDGGPLPPDDPGRAPVSRGPAYLARRLDDSWLATYPEKTLYVLYNVTLGTTSELGAEITARIRRHGIRRVILDLRHNPGGNNTAYDGLLDALLAGPPLTILTSRTTFSAAANLIGDLYAGGAEPTLIGEPTGAAPNFYGDPVPVSLPETGLSAHVAGVYWEDAGAGDDRLAYEPDVSAVLTWEDFDAGRDPVLTAALGRAPR